MLSKTSNRSRLEIKSIVNDYRIHTDGFEIWEMFNEILTSKSGINYESILPPISEDEFSYYLNDIQVYTLFEFSPIQIDEIESMILSLKESKSHILLNPTKY